MQRLQLSKPVVKLAVIHVLLFTLAFFLTIIPSTFAKQSQTNSTNGFKIQTTKLSITTPQQLLEQGKVLYQAGRFAEAVTVLQQAIARYQQEGDNLGQAVVWSNLSLAFEQLDSWKQAAEAVNTSLKLLGWNEKNQKLKFNNQKSELLEVLASTLDIQGRVQLALGQANLSIETSKQAEQIWKQLGNDTGVTRSRINQAQALLVAGFFRRSLEILNDVSQQLESQPDSVIKVTALRSLGNTQQQLGDLENSEKNLQLSLEIAKRLRFPQEISLTEFLLGNTARARGDIKDAIAHYQKAAETSTSRLTKAQAQINQLSLLIKNEQIPQAQTLIPTIQSQISSLPTNQAGIYARINFARTISKISNKRDIAQLLATSIQQAKTIGAQRAESYALGSLGEIYEQNNQWREAQDLTQQALLIAQQIDAPDIAYRWQWQTGRLLKTQGNIQGAVAAYDAAVTTLQLIRSDLVAANREVQFNFRDSVEPIYRQSVELLLREKGEGKPNLEKARQRIEALQVAELDNFFQEACLNNQFVVLDQVVDRDNPNTAILYPIILENRLEVIVKLPRQKLIHKSSLVSREEVEQVITAMRKAIVQRNISEQFPVASEQLYKWLIQPVATELKNSGVNTLVFIPDGLLRNISMAALYDGKQYLLEKYAIAISPGLQLFTPKPLIKQKLSVLAAGLSQPPQDENFASLPAVKVELKSIQELGVSTTILLDKDFTSTALEKIINTKPFTVVHLATHGQFSSKAKDTFILAADKRINVNEFNTLLKSREQKLSEPIDLLVLSACETAVGDNRSALGLAGVALRAGTRSTVASLWQISDESTALFTDEFYRELKTGKTTAQALRLAQLKLLKNNGYTSPLYWAPYVLVGNWL